MENNQNQIKIDLIKSLLQKLNFLLHDADFYVYQYLKSIDWLDDEQILSIDDLNEIDRELSDNFRKQHNLVSKFLCQIKIDNNKMAEEINRIEMENKKQFQTNEPNESNEPNENEHQTNLVD